MANLVRRGEVGIPDLRQEIDSLFEQFFSPGAMAAGYRTADFVPKLEVTETEDHYLMHAEVPGVAPEDVDIDVNNNVLTLRGQKKREEKRDFQGYEYTERSYGSFVRSIQLPPGADTAKIEADVRNGVLEVRIPKGEAARPRRIAVGGKQKATEASAVKSSSGSEKRQESSASERQESSNDKSRQGARSH